MISHCIFAKAQLIKEPEVCHVKINLVIKSLLFSNFDMELD